MGSPVRIAMAEVNSCGEAVHFCPARGRGALRRILWASLPAVFLVTAVTPARPAVLLSEDFEGVSLRPFESPTESNSDGTDWTPNLPPGWTLEFVGPAGNPIEFRGWHIL